MDESFVHSRRVVSQTRVTPGSTTSQVIKLHQKTSLRFDWIERSVRRIVSGALFLTKGIHALKFGFTLERDQLNTGGPGGFAGGWSTFSNFAKFLDGSPVSLIANSGVGDLSTHPRQWIWGTYVQDDVRLTPHLTV